MSIESLRSNVKELAFDDLLSEYRLAVKLNLDEAMDIIEDELERRTI